MQENLEMEMSEDEIDFMSYDAATKDKMFSLGIVIGGRLKLLNDTQELGL